MAVTALILAIAGYCICWLPGVGWLGVAFGLTACALAVPSITIWFDRQGYTGWGIAGVSLGGVDAALGLAYQVKHLGGALDFLVVPLPAPLAFYALGGCAALVVIALILGRTKARVPGMVVASLAIAATIVVGSWTLTTADRALTSETAAVASED